jgi:hypothetical protein
LNWRKKENIEIPVDNERSQSNTRIRGIIDGRMGELEQAVK